jgi:hypothetical protein
MRHQSLILIMMDITLLVMHGGVFQISIHTEEPINAHISFDIVFDTCAPITLCSMCGLLGLRASISIPLLGIDGTHT